MRRFKWVVVILFGLSLLYDRGVIRRGDRAGWLEPYTALTVVAGVLYTLAGVWAVDRKAAVLTFWAFVASGAPMIAGDLERYLERVRNGERVLVNLEARYGTGGGAGFDAGR
jgi:hypothetical protein